MTSDFEYPELQLFINGEWRQTSHDMAVVNPATEAERLEARHAAPTLWDAFVRLLSRSGSDIPNSILDRDVSQPIIENAAVQQAIIGQYSDERFAGLCEMMTDLDEGIQEWRYRHVMMVRRTIGTKPGTGGSDGASYLATTLFKPAFPDLWAIRTAF